MPSTSELDITTPTGHGNATEYLDSLGRVIQIVPPSPYYPISFTFSQGRLKTVTQGTAPNDRVYDTTFDSTYGNASSGYPSSVLDALDHTANLVPDAFGRPLTMTVDPTGLNLATSMTYDGAGDLTSVTLPGNAQHGQTFTLGQRIKTYTAPPPSTGAGSLLTQFTYNADRQLAREDVPTGAYVIHNYNGTTGRLEGLDSSSTDTSYTYHDPYTAGGGHLATADATTHWGSTDQETVHTTFDYDGYLLTSVGWQWPVGTSQASLLRTYEDGDLRVQGEKFTLSSKNYPSSFGYDADGLLTCAAAAASPCTGAAAHLDVDRGGPMGAVAGSSIPSGSAGNKIEDGWTYNNYGEVASYSAGVFDAGNNLQPPWLYTVTYDDASNPRDKLGRVVYKQDSLDGNTTYTYDAANRLASVTVGTTTVNYYYDSDGNRRLVQTPAVPPATKYDDDDRLLQWDSHLHYTWNDDGQLATRHDDNTGSDTTYTYDQFGNLTDVTSTNGTSPYHVQYLLDGLRRRVARGTFSGGAFSATEQYFYLDALRIGAVRHGSAVTYLVYGTRRNTPDLAVNDDGSTTKTYRIISDELGSPRLVVNIDDPTGDQPFSASYDAWGKSTRSGTWADWFPFDFAGGLYDPDTKLVRFGERDYDPEVGRWTNRDPIRFRGGQGNLYVYAGDDPVNRTDPNGLWGFAFGGHADAGFCWGLCIGSWNAGLGFYIGTEGYGLYTTGSGGLGLGAHAGLGGELNFYSSLDALRGTSGGVEGTAGAEGVASGWFFGNKHGIVLGASGGLGGGIYGGVAASHTWTTGLPWGPPPAPLVCK